MEKTDETISAIRFAALNYLVRREHSEKELRTKLIKKYSHPDLVNVALQTLKMDGLLSDQRFAEIFVNMRRRQGKGEKLIQMELKQKGICFGDTIFSGIELNNSESWKEIALRTYRKKYGTTQCLDIKEKSKRIRFLMSRGFSNTDIQYVFTCLADEYEF